MGYTPERTKAAIFQAAVEEFAARGLAGARVDRIAASAGADKKAIYLYFGDKRELFNAVLAHELERLAEAVPFDGDVPDYVGRLFDYHCEHPQHLRLMLWESLELGADEVPAQAARAAHYRRRPAPLAEAIRDGNLDPSLDPAGLMLILAGMVGWTFAVPQMARMVLGDAPSVLASQRALLLDCAHRLVGTTPPRS
ncbi:TetR family transcriptional regulator [Pseudonocardia spinosispora]|uniref:TetR family transcriptional regulator n=1 Tax=Pseudonocardia spinosispora TaxID=103441 RepID=UPI00040CD6B0|nr:TetR family transcriptional regulator [Pseudonocardia spinosispora]